MQLSVSCSSMYNVYLSLFPSLSNADDNEFRSVLAFISREDGFRAKSRRLFPARNSFNDDDLYDNLPGDRATDAAARSIPEERKTDLGLLTRASRASPTSPTDRKFADGKTQSSF